MIPGVGPLEVHQDEYMIPGVGRIKCRAALDPLPASANRQRVDHMRCSGGGVVAFKILEKSPSLGLMNFGARADAFVRAHDF